MLDWLRKVFSYKTVDLEAKLRPTPECTFGGSGEVEVEVWSDGNASIEAELKNSGVPAGTELELICANARIMNLAVTGGYAKQTLTFSEPRKPPRIEAGDTAELRLDGRVMYNGTFRLD